MEYWCNLWAGAPSCYLAMLVKLQKRIYGTVGPSLAASFEPLAHRQNDIHLNWLNWFHVLILEGVLLAILNRLHDFSITIPRCYKDVYVNSFFSRTARLWNSLSIECNAFLQPII